MGSFGPAQVIGEASTQALLTAFSVGVAKAL